MQSEARLKNTEKIKRAYKAQFMGLKSLGRGEGGGGEVTTLLHYYITISRFFFKKKLRVNKA